MVGEYEYIFNDVDLWLDYYNDLEDHLSEFMFNYPEYIIDSELRTGENEYNELEYIIRIKVDKRKTINDYE